MDTSPDQSPSADAAARRLKMGNVMGLITLALLITFFLVPLPMKMAALIVGMVTFVYSAYNLVLYRYKKNVPSPSV